MESLNDVFDAGHDEVHGGGEGHGELGREPLKSVAYAFSLGFPHPNAVTSLVFECGANIPAIFAVGCPRAALRWWFVGNNSYARWSNGGGVVIEGAVDVSPSGELGVDA